jgi:Glycosyl hydrolases family 28
MNRRQLMMTLSGAMATATLARGGEPATQPSVGLPLFDPMHFGAVGDGKALDSPAINAAIDACMKAGGGLVYLRPGVYRSGTVILKSNVTLYLEAGAVILGSFDLADYTAQSGPPVRGDANQTHLIFAKDAENLTLAGPGRIDGQGPAFWELSGRTPLPPDEQWAEVAAHAWFKKTTGRASPMLEFVNCRWLRIQDVRIENAAGWTLRPINCDNVFIEGIAIKNPIIGPNTDGLDITGCQNVFVSNCSIDTGDDCICLKSENPYGSEPRVGRNIVVTNCVLTTCCNGFKIGTATQGGFENITFSNSVIYNAQAEFKDRVISGVALEIVDGGWIDGVVVTGIRMQRTRTPIFIRLGNRSQPHDYPQRGLRGVMIENIHASEALLASSITGLKGSEVQDVTLSNIRIDNVLPSRSDWPRRIVSEQENKYPEARMFGMLPASGLYVRHVRDLRLKDISFRSTASENRPTIIFDDVKNARISGLASTSINGDQPIVKLVDSSDVWISDSAAPPATGTFVETAGAGCSNILVSGCDLRSVGKAVEAIGDAPKSAATARGNILAEQ